LAAVEDAPRATLHELDAQALMGDWYVVRTTLDFWDTRTDPLLRYSPLPPDETGAARWTDTVHFRKNGKAKSVSGVDTKSRTRAGHFQWQGRGLLASMTSQCSIVALDPEGMWAVSWFSATLATPAGMDILVRELPARPEWIAAAEAQIARHPELQRWWTHARPTVHTVAGAPGGG
jgi:hypothetical protein